MCFTASHGCSTSLCLIIFLIHTPAWGLVSAKCNVCSLSGIHDLCIQKQYSPAHLSRNIAVLWRKSNVNSDKRDRNSEDMGADNKITAMPEAEYHSGSL